MIRLSFEYSFTKLPQLVDPYGFFMGQKKIVASDDFFQPHFFLRRINKIPEKNRYDTSRLAVRDYFGTFFVEVGKGYYEAAGEKKSLEANISKRKIF